jgi:large conductance mechanosensitive channel
MDKVINHSKKTVKKIAPATAKSLNKHAGGFGDFIREYGVVGLAIGFVFGAQVKSVVDVFTTSIINPLVGLLLPGTGNLNQKTLVVSVFGKQATFGWGIFLSSLISFFLIAIIIYFTFKLFNLEKLAKKK